MATPEEQVRTMLQNLESKTGISIGDWVQIVAETGLVKHSEIVEMLKTSHPVTHSYANLVAHEAYDAAG